MQIALGVALAVAVTVIEVTASVCAMEEPQALFAVTVMLPLVALAVALIDVVVLVPVHPEGKTQV